MSCALTESERSYELQVPVGYWTLSSMPDFSFEEWLQTIRVAGERKQMRPALAHKILNSLLRMPDLKEDQTAIFSYSHGKDSQAFFMLGRMKYPKDRILPLFCDTKDEWQETYDFHPIFEEWIDVPITVLDTIGLHDNIRQKGFFPKPSQRWCTKELKMLPQRDYMDYAGYDQVRGDRLPATLRDSLGKTAYEVKHPSPIMFSGERWSESEARSKLPFDERVPELLRWTHRPVLDWTIEDIWDFIFWMQAPFNQVYLKGIKRCACAGCIYADPKEFRLLGKYHPAHLLRWSETEGIVGVDFKPNKFSIRKLYNEMETNGELGMYSEGNVPLHTMTEAEKVRVDYSIMHYYHYGNEYWPDSRIAEMITYDFGVHDGESTRGFQASPELGVKIEAMDMMAYLKCFREERGIPDLVTEKDAFWEWNKQYRLEYRANQVAMTKAMSEDKLKTLAVQYKLTGHWCESKIIGLLSEGKVTEAVKQAKESIIGGGTFGEWGSLDRDAKGLEIKPHDGRVIKLTWSEAIELYRKKFLDERIKVLRELAGQYIMNGA